MSPSLLHGSSAQQTPSTCCGVSTRFQMWTSPSRHQAQARAYPRASTPCNAAAEWCWWECRPARRQLRYSKVVSREIDVVGSYRYTIEYAEAVDALATGLDITPLLSGSFALDQAEQAFTLASDRKRAMKVCMSGAIPCGSDIAGGMPRPPRDPVLRLRPDGPIRGRCHPTNR